MRAPLVTVAIPTRNRARMLRDALESLATQTFPDFEVVVCDNASDDETPDVVRSFDRRFRLDRSPADIGFAANHLRALDAGSGPYLTILQDDDVLAPRSLERRVALLDRERDVAMVHSAFTVGDIDLEPIEKVASWDGSAVDVIRAPDEFRWRTFADGRRSHLSMSLYRRAALDTRTLDLFDAEVLELAASLRCSLYGRIGFIAEPLGTVRYHIGQNAVNSGVADARAAFARTFAQVKLFRDETRRFLMLFGRELPNARELDRAAAKWARFELARQCLAALPPRPAPIATAAKLRDSARIEPSMRRDVRSAWVLLNGTVGPRQRATLARLARRPQTNEEQEGRTRAR